MIIIKYILLNYNLQPIHTHDKYNIKTIFVVNFRYIMCIYYIDHFLIYINKIN